MSKALVIRDMRYQVSGKYIYEGDFIITNGVLYYFPHTDLLQQRINRATSLASGVAGGMVGGIIGGLGAGAIRGLQQSAHREDHEKALDNPTILKSRLDSVIAEIKEKHSKDISANSLPLPMRYSSDEISEFSVSFFGVFSFKTKYEQHVFKTSMRYSKKIKESLSQNGFIM